MAGSIFLIDISKTIVLVLYSTLVAIVKFCIPIRFRMKSVEDKIILITGAGSGLGASLAIKFAKRKARLVLWDVNTEGLSDTVVKCRQYQSGALILSSTVDVSDRNQVLAEADKIKSDMGYVDILINNAGIVSGKTILQIDEKSAQKTFSVNTLAHIWTIQAFLPDMLVRNSGQIVCISSLGAYAGMTKLADYCASKVAASSIQESLEREIHVAKRPGVTCLTVCPFFINTGMFDGVESPSPLLPILELNDISTKIEEAILTNANLLIVPRIAYLLLVVKSIIPVKAMSHVLDMIHVDKCMDRFRGRRKMSN